MSLLFVPNSIFEKCPKEAKGKRGNQKWHRKHLCYLESNIRYIHELLFPFKHIPLYRIEYRYLQVIQTLYEQQKYMHDQSVRSVDFRIVSIQQPHLLPILCGKSNAWVEFGAKIQVSIMNDLVFQEYLLWGAFNVAVGQEWACCSIPFYATGINITNLKPGIYLLKLQDDEKTKTTRFMVQ